MKKYILLVVAAAIIVLAGCNLLTSADSADTEAVDNNQGVKEEGKHSKENNNERQTEEAAAEGQAEEKEEVLPAETESEPKYELTGNWSIKPLDENADKDIVLLTIDDAPDEHALEMAKTLKELDAKAIFFVNGHFLATEEQQQVLKQIHDMGFEIGNHTFNHQALVEASEEVQKEEIVSLNDLIEDITGERPKFFRAPHGQNTDYSRKIAAEQGMLLMNWSYGYDWNEQYRNEDALADIMVNTNLLVSGANLLMHDREWTAAALDDIVEGIRSKGYQIADPALIQVEE
ncbi:polysaccharide deacetylase family protein [Sediminibacillus albus]|uniref:Peptidoglycan/xylan/chitin deacetylase, PgdA/CDA1 family n=1 Tax=Sediminibacillus albus TaxID=407036 RepID=A0A1G8WAL8_9BACI|nr:polysaccharide deacetylase family protein [Sediminibacillus albus]SDJ75284.1 Peptidoglycan/xylan/chitin deacetylase, PgdA/CDA1 family [Sediminibacillus albus]